MTRRFTMEDGRMCGNDCKPWGYCAKHTASSSNYMQIVCKWVRCCNEICGKNADSSGYCDEHRTLLGIHKPQPLQSCVSLPPGSKCPHCSGDLGGKMFELPNNNSFYVGNE